MRGSDYERRAFELLPLDGVSRIVKYASTGHITSQISAAETASDALCFSHALTKFTTATVTKPEIAA